LQAEQNGLQFEKGQNALVLYRKGSRKDFK